MRHVFYALAALVLAPTGHLLADDQIEIKALAAKVVKAAGGADKLAKLQAVEWKSKATIHFNGGSQQELIVVNRDKCWLHSGKDTVDAPNDFAPIIKGGFYAVRIAQLLPLTDKAYELAPFGEAKVGERNAVGIRVSRKDQQDSTLFFDKETNLLLKGETRVKEKNGQEVLYEFYCGEHKDFDGLKHFTKFTLKRDGKDFVDIELSELTPKEKVDDAVFAKP